MIEKHEIPTEKSFMSKLRDVMGALVNTPKGFQNRATLLQGIAQKVSKRCDTLGCNLVEGLGSTPGAVVPAKEHIQTPTS